MIGLFIASGMALIADAAPAQQTAPSFEVAVEHGTWAPGERPYIFVEVKNRGAADICAYGGVWEPDSMELSLSLRTPRRALAFAETGYIPPPPGEIRIEATKSFRARYYLDTRFKAFRNNRIQRGPLSARVSFRYHLCESADWAVFRTDWMRL